MSDDLQKIIDDAVAKALAGDMDAINTIEDRVTRSKAKAALVKAKRASEQASVTAPAQQESTPASTMVDIKAESLDQKILALISSKFPQSNASLVEKNVIVLAADQWYEIAEFLRDFPDFCFDSLQCITGVDPGMESESLEVFYNLHSMSKNHRIEVRIIVSRSEPKVPSVETVWSIADWFERETYDMYGIEFSGHRNLKRILLPDDWTGWPLRKDYTTPDYYHGIAVPKVKEGWE